MDLIDFFKEIGKLKKIKRSGWLVSGVKNPESVADHSFRMSIMVMVLGRNKNIDMEKAIKIALVHDIAEAETGDIITWKDYHMTNDEKRPLEKKAIKKIVKILGKRGDEILRLWEEFGKGKSKVCSQIKDFAACAR